MLLFEKTKLMPQCQVFQEQLTARAKESSGEKDQEPEQAQHQASFTSVSYTHLDVYKRQDRRVVHIRTPSR